MPEPLHWSHLRNMAKSPAHYRHALTEGVTQTPAMRLGALIHAVAFKQDRFVVHAGDRRGKGWAQFQAENEGKEIATREEMDRAESIAEAALSDPVAAPFLRGTVEQRIAWKIGDRECAGTPDVRGVDPNGIPFVCDLKSTTDASPGRFPNYAMRSAYLAQLAWYVNGIGAAGLPVPGRVLIVAIEVKPPYNPTVYELTEGALNLGARTWRLLFERLMACEAAGEFPGYAQAPLVLDAPEELTLSLNGEEIEL